MIAGPVANKVGLRHRIESNGVGPKLRLLQA